MNPSPPNALETASEVFFDTLPICGPFSITAELPDMQTVIRYMEKQGLPNQGYYRLVRHPWYRQIQIEVQQATGWPEALLYPSAMLALHAVLEARSVDTAARKVALIGSNASRLQQISSALKTLRLERVPTPSEADHSLIVLDREDIPPPGNLPVIAFPDASQPLPNEATHGIVLLTTEDGAVEGAALCLRNQEAAVALYERNKKRGAVLSLRHLARLTGHDDEVPDGPGQANSLALQRLCELEEATSGQLFSSGMHAVATLLDLLKKPGKNHVVVVGHVYSDTHYLMTEIPWCDEPMQVDFLNSNEEDLVGNLLKENTFAVFVETLTNPLNEVPDLEKIISQADARGIPVIVDNTMASPCNCQPITLGAAAVIHSTTKYLSGDNIHGGGAVLTNQPELARELHSWCASWEIDLSPLEGRLLWDQMQDVEERMLRFNHNGLAVAEFLEQHPKVKKVFYSGLPSSPYFETASKWLKGGASVVSFLLHKDHLEGVTRFYNADLRPVRKAPTLGSNITLMCPYTLLTYYHKPDEYLEDIPLSRYLIRLAVGSEPDLSRVLAALQRGLEAV